jgi:hypothetical protein
MNDTMPKEAEEITSLIGANERKRPPDNENPVIRETIRQVRKSIETVPDTLGGFAAERIFPSVLAGTDTLQAFEISSRSNLVTLKMTGLEDLTRYWIMPGALVTDATDTIFFTDKINPKMESLILHSKSEDLKKRGSREGYGIVPITIVPSTPEPNYRYTDYSGLNSKETAPSTEDPEEIKQIPYTIVEKINSEDEPENYTDPEKRMRVPADYDSDSEPAIRMPYPRSQDYVGMEISSDNRPEMQTENDLLTLQREEDFPQLLDPSKYILGLTYFNRIYGALHSGSLHELTKEVSNWETFYEKFKPILLSPDLVVVQNRHPYINKYDKPEDYYLVFARTTDTDEVWYSTNVARKEGSGDKINRWLFGIPKFQKEVFYIPE